MKRLRGHHLFCGTLFQGHGYDEAFANRVEDVLSQLASGENVILCAGSDDFCGACPHRREENGCALGTEDVSRRDQAALKAVGLAVGQELRPAQVGERLRKVTEAQWEQVCGNCRWQKEGLCSWKLFQKLRQERFV